MKREIIISEDGSSTIYVRELDEHYHSVFGARTESMHVFISAGLKYLYEQGMGDLNILEVGFGTGLNAYLTALERKQWSSVNYYSIEKYPLDEKEWSAVNYPLTDDTKPWLFKTLHEVSWESWEEIEQGFMLYKSRMDLNSFIPPENQHLIYFDAFAPDVQPDLWSLENFTRLYSSLVPGGVLVTYSVKGVVKRNLAAAGFTISKIPGPRGKRHILRAIK